MTDIQSVTTVAQELALARTEAPSEVIVAPDGSQHVIQWQGTPAPRHWVTSFLDGLVTARLIEPFPDIPAGLSEAETVIAQRRLDDRLNEWHKVLAGMPLELLTAAGQHFRLNGVPDGRWGYLRPSDLSRWIRPRLRRRIPPADECTSHPGHWADRCGQCAENRRTSRTKTSSILAGIRRELAQRKDPA
ncbi:hypothetical protein [Brachybacterium hainanense]|uniref:Uncharacterized protein n=1 Tax=Brachybacterium hainanense TaxID=1541174 RepID=A0ABV6R976_9MICO